MSNVKHYIDLLHQLTNIIDFKNFKSNPIIAKEYISRLSRFTGNNLLNTFTMNYKTEGINFYRAVSYKKPNEEYKNLKEMWYPEDKGKIKYVGRANFPHKQVLYCTDRSGKTLAN